MQSVVRWVGWVGLASLSLAGVAQAVITNTVPWVESFEAYPVGTSLAGVNGWGGDPSAPPVVSGGAEQCASLASYTNTAGRSYPLAGATHTNMLRLAAETTNSLVSATTNGVVTVDVMALPTWCATAPEGRARNQLAVFVGTNGLLSLWHEDRTVSPPSNTWLCLTNSPLIGTDTWVRLTFVQDYTNHMYQVSVDGLPLVDARGWSYGGVSPGGSWFHMAATNSGGMSRFIAEAAPAYLDDLSATMRALSWSRSNFVESVTNNGSIDNSTPLTITLSQDTFTGTVGEDLARSGKFVASGVPSNLVVVARQASSTTVQVTLTNRALAHQQADSVVGLVMRFTDAAFTLGRAYDVAGSVLASGSIGFQDAPVLSYGTTVFMEPIINDGSVGGTTITLAGKLFNAAQGEDLVAAHKVTVANLPAGLGVQVIRGMSASGATLVFTGTAVNHAAKDSLSNLSLVFGDAAFTDGQAAQTVNASRTDLVIQFRDPRVVSYSATTFNELSGGQMDNRKPVTLTLAGDTFMGTVGTDFAAAGKIVVDNLPAGLAAQVTLVTASQLSVQLTGTAPANTSADSVSNVVFTLQDSAFTLQNAASVVNHRKSGIKVLFNDLTGIYNLVPFTDNFESYPAGFRVGGSNGWSAVNLPTAGLVTNASAVSAALAGYLAVPRHTYPISGAHSQTLLVSDDLRNEIHSGDLPMVYVDFLMIPSVASEVDADTNNQVACYINTNLQVVVWHSNRTSQTCEWLVLSNAPAVNTSAWMRMTFQCDYSSNMFQLRLNEGDPVMSPQGWTQAGAAPTGSWFYMAQTHGTMSRFKLTGGGALYLDDLAVREALPTDFGGGYPGTVYLFR